MLKLSNSLPTRPVTIPQTIAGRISAPVPFSILTVGHAQHKNFADSGKILVKSSARDHPDSASTRSHLSAILCEKVPHKNTTDIIFYNRPHLLAFEKMMRPFQWTLILI